MRSQANGRYQEGNRGSGFGINAVPVMSWMLRKQPFPNIPQSGDVRPAYKQSQCRGSGQSWPFTVREPKMSAATPTLDEFVVNHMRGGCHAQK